MSLVVRAVLVFLAVVAYDICWATYIQHVTGRNRWYAAAWSSLVYMFGSVAIVQYTHETWLVIPAALGAFVGTALVVR